MACNRNYFTSLLYRPFTAMYSFMAYLHTALLGWFGNADQFADGVCKRFTMCE